MWGQYFIASIGPERVILFKEFQNAFFLYLKASEIELSLWLIMGMFPTIFSS